MRNYVNVATEELKTPYLVILGVVIGFFVLLWGMVELNTSGHQGWNIPIAIMGGIAIAAVLLRPTPLVQSSIGGFIYAFFADKDKSQGVVTGPAFLGKFAFVLLYSFVLIAFTLATWSFVRFPEGAWIVVVGVFLLIGAGYVFKGLEFGKVTPYIACGWVAFCVLAALYMSLGTYAGRNYNPHNGAAEYMINQRTGQLDDLGRKPEDCVEQKCFDQTTGEELVPATSKYRDQLMQRSPQGLAALATTEAEKHTATASSSSISVPGDTRTWIKWAVIILVVMVVLSLVFRRGGGAIVPIAVLALIFGGLYWWSTSDAKAVEVCQAEDSPAWVMKLDELRPLTAGCTKYRVHDKLLPYDKNGIALFGTGSPDITVPIEEIAVVKRAGNDLVIWVSETEMKRNNLKTMRFGFCKKPADPTDNCVFPTAAVKIDMEKVEAAIAGS